MTTMPSILRIHVPIPAVGLNHAVKHTRAGKHYRTKAANSILPAVHAALAGRSVWGKYFEVHILVTLGKGQRLDADGGGKLIVDALAVCGAFSNHKGKKLSDAHVFGVAAYKDSWTRPELGCFDVSIFGMGVDGVKGTANALRVKEGQ
jgi:hypothetical protein